VPALALPGLAIIGALLALLLLYGARYLTHLLGHLLDIHIPVVNINIGQVVENALDGALAIVRIELENAAAPIAKVISYPVTAAKGMLTEIADTLSEAGVIIRTIKRVYVPHLISVAVAQLHQLVSAVETTLLGDISAARSYALGLVNAARTYALGLANHVYAVLNAALTLAVSQLHQLISAVETHLLAVISAVESHVLAVVASVEQTLAARIVALQAWTTAQVQGALAFTAARFAQAEADIVTAERAAVAQSIGLVDAGIVHGLSDVWGDVTSAAAAAEGVIATDFPDILSGLKAIATDVPADIAGVAALTGGLSIALARYLERCGIPNCRNLSQYGRDLQALLALAEGSVFLDLLIELVEHPQQAAHDLDSLIGGTARGVVREGASLLGVG